MMLIRTSTETWNAEYTVQGNRDAQIVRIKSLSSITVVIAKIMENLPTLHSLPMQKEFILLAVTAPMRDILTAASRDWPGPL